MRTLYGAIAAIAIIAFLITVCAVAIDGPSAAGDHVSRPNVLHLKLDK